MAQKMLERHDKTTIRNSYIFHTFYLPSKLSDTVSLPAVTGPVPSVPGSSRAALVIVVIASPSPAAGFSTLRPGVAVAAA